MVRCPAMQRSVEIAADLLFLLSENQLRFPYMKAALFDLDGVVIDSETLYTRFWNDINRLYPVDIDNFAIAIKGRTLPEILEYYPEASVREEITRRLMEFQDNMDFIPLPGVEDYLGWLRDHGYPVALVTSSDKRKMECLRAKAPAVMDYFTVIIDGNMVTRSKPDPQGYLMAAERLGVEAGDCVVFEDSINGLKAARASGALVVGLATTLPMAEIAPYCDMTFHTWSEIIASNPFS